MCGLSRVYQYCGDPLQEEILRGMMHCIPHHGPDGEGGKFRGSRHFGVMVTTSQRNRRLRQRRWACERDYPEGVIRMGAPDILDTGDQEQAKRDEEVECP
jgi:hypothetical protein